MPISERFTRAELLPNIYREFFASETFLFCTQYIVFVGRGISTFSVCNAEANRRAAYRSSFSPLKFGVYRVFLHSQISRNIETKETARRLKDGESSFGSEKHVQGHGSTTHIRGLKSSLEVGVVIARAYSRKCARQVCLVNKGYAKSYQSQLAARAVATRQSAVYNHSLTETTVGDDRIRNSI